MSVTDFLTTPARQLAVLEEAEHRPWPLPPPDRWLMAQTWERLLFAHWAVPVEAVRAHVPSQLDVDTFEGTAWVGITPFRISGLRLRGVPPAPLLSTFLELNARTYVSLGGKPGIWFFSLDASSRLAVEVARRAYKLPYFPAQMSARFSDPAVHFRSVRTERLARRAELRARYEPQGEVFRAEPGSREHFIAERYCLYAVHAGKAYRADIHHKPWPLQRAQAEIERNTVSPPGIGTDGPPLLHFAARQDVLIWPLEAVGEDSSGKTA